MDRSPRTVRVEARPGVDVATAIARARADGARGVVVAVARIADATARVGPDAAGVIVAGRADGLDAAALEALRDRGVARLRVVWGGMRERVYEAVVGAPGTWRAAATGLAAALTGPIPIEVELPLVAWNADDAVPWIEWLLALPGRVVQVSLAMPPTDGARALRHDRVAALAAAVFARCRAARVACGFAGGDAPWPCAAGDKLDDHATVWHDAVRRWEHDAHRGRERIAACATCAVAAACGGIDRPYRARFGDDHLTAVPAARVQRWRLRPTRGGGEVDYAQISPFANVSDGRGRGLVRVNGHCQMACAFCFVDRGVGDLPRDVVVAELDRIAATQRDHLVLSGGEPTLHPDLAAFLAHARDLGFATIEIQTNGVRCADPAYASALVAAGLTKATVSLHSMEPAASDAITRMPGAFARTVAGLHQLAALGVDTQLAHVISRDNAAALPAFTRAMLDEFAGAGRRLSVCFAVAQPMSDLVAPWAVPTFTEVRTQLRAALDLCDQRGVGYGGLIGQGGFPPCQLDGELRYYRGVLDKIYASADADQQFAKAPQCAQCDFDRACLGVRRAYLARHGADELRPITLSAEDRARLPTVTATPHLVSLGRRS